MRRIRPHLSFANVVSVIALFVALGGGTTAVALSGQNTVQSDDLGPGAQVLAPDIGNNAVNSADVANNSLTGADIRDKSGVDTCVATHRLGNLCVRAENDHRGWFNAALHCANLGLRLPTLAEGMQLGRTFDIPNVDESETFWTGDRYSTTSGDYADTGNESGNGGAAPIFGDTEFETVCVTTPNN
jgi:hypothetical protein